MKNRLAVNYQRQSQSMNIIKEQQWSWWTSCYSSTGCGVCSDDINNPGRACTLFAQYLQSYQPLSSGSANVAQCYAALTVCSGHWQCGECFARLPSSPHCYLYRVAGLS